MICGELYQQGGKSWRQGKLLSWRVEHSTGVEEEEEAGRATEGLSLHHCLAESKGVEEERAEEGSTQV